MTAPDGYTKHLLGMAWERFDRTLGGWFTVNKQVNHGYIIEYAVSPGLPIVRTPLATTLTEALTALLGEIGVDAPERPTARDLARMEHTELLDGELHEALPKLRGLCAHEPLTFLALLEGGVS